MSVNTHPRTPLIISCTPEAQEQANKLGLTRPLENLVYDAIVAGAIHGEPSRVGGVTGVYLDAQGVVVDVKRIRLRPSGRKAWAPIGVRPLRRGAT